MARPRLGSGERHRQLSAKLKKRGARNPDALAAWVGRRKFGKARYQQLAARGRRR
jgi:hypothetical protein